MTLSEKDEKKIPQEAWIVAHNFFAAVILSLKRGIRKTMCEQTAK